MASDFPSDLEKYILNFSDVKHISTVNKKSSHNENLPWASWGVRDCAPFTDSSGSFLIKNGLLPISYTAGTDYGRTQSTGVVYLDVDTNVVYKHPTPIILPGSVGEWDSKIASTSWVIFWRSRYYLYYRGSSDQGKNDAIGLALSDDGVNFTKYKNNPVLLNSAFKGMKQSSCLMGVLNAVESYEGNLVISFEANEAESARRAQIFSAVSNDGIDFKPMNDGFPTFSFRNVNSWPVTAVCNPRIIRLENGWYMLGFNGTYNSDYSIGFAFTKDFNIWYEHPQNPVMIPTCGSELASITYRLEGPVISRNDILYRQTEFDCFIMGIPIGATNHQCAENLRIRFCREDSENNEAHPLLSRSIDLDKTISTGQVNRFLNHVLRRGESISLRFSPFKDDIIYFSVSYGFVNFLMPQAEIFLYKNGYFFRAKKNIFTDFIIKVFSYVSHMNFYNRFFGLSRLKPYKFKNWDRFYTLSSTSFDLHIHSYKNNETVIECGDKLFGRYVESISNNGAVFNLLLENHDGSIERLK